MTMTFETALENFRAAAEQTVRAHYARNDFTFATPGVEISRGGRRFAKLWNHEQRDGVSTCRSIHSFVEIETGDVFMPASTKAPAKHARGNVFVNDGRESLTDTGSVRYLR